MSDSDIIITTKTHPPDSYEQMAGRGTRDDTPDTDNMAELEYFRHELENGRPLTSELGDMRLRAYVDHPASSFVNIRVERKDRRGWYPAYGNSIGYSDADSKSKDKAFEKGFEDFLKQIRWMEEQGPSGSTKP